MGFTFTQLRIYHLFINQDLCFNNSDWNYTLIKLSPWISVSYWCKCFDESLYWHLLWSIKNSLWKKSIFNGFVSLVNVSGLCLVSSCLPNWDVQWPPGTIANVIWNILFLWSYKCLNTDYILNFYFLWW